MKKIVIFVILFAVAVLLFYISSNARQGAFLPRPEDKAGQAASPFMPEEIEGGRAPKGTEKLKVTGPVYDLDIEK